MRLKEVDVRGVEYEILRNGSEGIIGIELLASDESKNFFRHFPDAVMKDKAKITFGAKGIIFRTDSEICEICLGKKEKDALSHLFRKIRDEKKKIQLVPLLGINPGLQLLSPFQS